MSRAELARWIAVIRSDMDTLLRLFPNPADFRNEFAAFVTDLDDLASASDQTCVRDQIDHVCASTAPKLSRQARPLLIIAPKFARSLTKSKFLNRHRSGCRLSRHRGHGSANRPHCFSGFNAKS